MTAGVLTAGSWIATNSSARADTPEGPTEKVQQPLVGGVEVDAETQEKYGLLTLDMGAGTCSASLLRNDWAITAAHCVEAEDAAGNPMADANRTGQNVLVPVTNVNLTAVWRAQTAQPSSIVTFRPYDVALIHLDAPLMVNGKRSGYRRQVFQNSPKDVTIHSYGRGISQFATGSGKSAMPSQRDGLFRVASFKVTRDDDTTYSYPTASGQMIAGGDSGGPALNDNDELVGVHSTAHAEYVAGKPQEWSWATKTTSANDAPIKPVWKKIELLMKETVSRSRLVSNDFDKDGYADILWHNATTNESQIWYMSGPLRIGRATILDENGKAILVGSPWVIVGSRDFNGDGKTDLLWYNLKTGETQIWQMNDNKVSGRATVVGEDGKAIFIGPPWGIVGANDFDGDGASDILWHNSATGETQIWFMKGNKRSGRATVLDENGKALLVGLPWSIVSTNDFDRDGNTDILWYNGNSGETQIWQMNERRVISRSTVTDENGKAILIGPPWILVGTNDFNGDGAADILWHKDIGEIQIWLMKGHSIVRRATVNADRDGGGARVMAPWNIMNH